MFVIESIAFFEPSKLIGDDARKDGAQHGAGQMAFDQSTDVEIDVVDRVVNQRQPFHHRFIHDGQQFFEGFHRRQSADLTVGVVAGQTVIATAPQIQRDQVETEIPFWTSRYK